jgi:hypothetical protein
MEASAQSIGRSFYTRTSPRRFRGLRLEQSHQLRARPFLIAMIPGLLSGDAPLSRNQTAKYAAPIGKSKPYNEQPRERSCHFPNPKKSPILKGGEAWEPQAQGAFGPRLGPRARALRVRNKDAQPRLGTRLRLSISIEIGD